MKVTAASQNQRSVRQRFGCATQFLIYEVKESGFRLVDIRQDWPLCSTQQHKTVS
jgi:predicted Fe-Mo cluster-binding NifX family protein